MPPRPWPDTVSDRFPIRGRGIVLLPGIIPVGDERFRVGDTVRLKRPDGVEVEATIRGLEMFNRTGVASGVMLGLDKEHVPVGTEVWSVDAGSGVERRNA